MVLEGLAQRCQCQALGSAREQAHLQQILELAQGLGDGRLGYRQLIGGTADMPQASHLHEALEVRIFMRGNSIMAPSDPFADGITARL